jgi:low affinity Fe/Cu permease
MMANGKNNWSFSELAGAASCWLGTAGTFAVACAVVVIWALSGPVFGYLDTWQLLINTGTTIVTFLMVFLVQHTQNRDAGALRFKLDELLRSVKAVRRREEQKRMATAKSRPGEGAASAA